MKKCLNLLCAAMLIILVATGMQASAESVNDVWNTYAHAESLDQQLAVLAEFAAKNADELETGGWSRTWDVPAAPGLPEDLIPYYWEDGSFSDTDAFPAELRNRKMIAVQHKGSAENSLLILSGNLLARLPAEMRAASLEEAEYALVVDCVLTESGYRYIPSATSYHRDYSAYVLNLKTGEAIRFWSHRNSAKGSGKRNELNGEEFTAEEIWRQLRSLIWGQLRFEADDGTALIFGISGKTCYLLDCEGEPEALEIPAEVSGHRVVEIGESALENCQTLRRILLPEGLTRISSSAFYGCTSLEEISLPSSLTFLGDEAFRYCPKLARVIIPESVSSLSNDLFRLDDRIACIYLPESLNTDPGIAAIDRHAVIYAPAGSFALQWAQEQGYLTEACDNPADVPQPEYVTEGDFNFLVFREEATLYDYLGDGPRVEVPGSAAGFPVTRIVNPAFYYKKSISEIVLPAGIREITENAIIAGNEKEPTHLYLPGSEMHIEEKAIGGMNGHEMILHAPAGSTAQQYAGTSDDELLRFEPWGEELNPDVRILRDALDLAGQVQQSASEFWQSCDQTVYSWLRYVPGYDITRPDAAAVVRLTPAAFDDLALLMAGPENVVRVFATVVNTQWNLPYARAAAQTVRDARFDPVADNSCVLVVLCYNSDLVLFTLQQDGSAHAALICSSPDVTQSMSPEFVSTFTAPYGVSGDCTVYSGEEVLHLLSR